MSFAFPTIPSPHYPPTAQEALPARVEWWTVILAIVVHALWLLVTWAHAAMPVWVFVPLAGAVVAWHGSLQHETIHGHPTRWRLVNAVIGSMPLSLWLPYATYRRSHLGHHQAARITDPLDDPESHYLVHGRGWRGILARIEATLAGRLILGPPIRIGRFLMGEAARAWRTPGAWARDWVPHLVGVVAVLAWLDHVALPVFTYALTVVYPATAITLLRSFAEHRAAAAPQERAAIVERAGLLGLIFLNNNLHAVHHARPRLAWYRLPGEFARDRRAYAFAPAYRGYGEIARRFAFRTHDAIVHPDWAIVHPDWAIVHPDWAIVHPDREGEAANPLPA